MCLLHGSTSLHSCVPPATTKSSLTNLACDQQKVQVIGCGQKLGENIAVNCCRIFLRKRRCTSVVQLN